MMTIARYTVGRNCYIKQGAVWYPAFVETNDGNTVRVYSTALGFAILVHHSRVATALKLSDRKR